jgi:ribonucleoside-diphosphate reductase alpha chain
LTSIIEKLSKERKELQAQGELPDWLTTQAWQLLKDKYLWNTNSLKDTFRRIARTLAKHAKTKPEWWLTTDTWEDKFFDVLWKGHLAASTPVLSNTGTTKGCPVSCSGNYVHDSIHGFYDARKEVAILTKNGFGTSSYLGDIRARGSKIASGGKASGVLPVFKGFVQDMRDVAQGTSRRGAWAGYLEIDHDDFYELVDHVYHYPDDANVGFIYSDAFIERLKNGDKDATERYQRHMKLRAVTGKGYFMFSDKVNRLNPPMYRDKGIEVKASQLCSEVLLYSGQDMTYTCVLSSLNLTKWDEWKDTDCVFVSTVFLDCVAQEFIELGRNIVGLEKAVLFTEKSRALGLGALGMHSLFQSKMLPFESMEAHLLNLDIFEHIQKEAEKASEWMAKEWGEPEWCKGYGKRATHLMAIAPNTSSALICGGVSQGIEPIVANVYTQNSAGGELERMNPTLIGIMKERGVYDEDHIHDVAVNNGSVQHVDWLTPIEKQVFKTAYEIDQKAIVRLANARSQFIDQGTSLNLFFDADEDEAYISEVHKEAILSPYIKTLYYMRSKAGVSASKGECVACEG